ncbi:hypothetical protein B0I37DRAFT_374299 [Chaetomium sp. MPI-CAGE-AT-0009]|nr:hypothetical protein B0I37DRAFT_374299 [Chaetomium sp. MPI-CAGE-AT-0009]
MAFLLVLVLIVSILAGTIASRHLRSPLPRPSQVSIRAGSLDSKGPCRAEDEPGEKGKTLGHDFTIEPLPDFDWTATPPLKLRPFKPTYNITMALQTSHPSDLIVLDNNYLNRVTTRRTLLTKHKSAVFGAIPPGHAPVRELYTYLLGTYLPARYPTIFHLSHSPAPTSPHKTLFHNRATGRIMPLSPLPSTADEMLQILGETVEDDLFLLLPDREGGAHRAVAFVCCHPAGFDPAEKLGKVLAEIHGPVPGYERIGGSMERYFGRLAVGRCVKRVNWSIQTHPRLYAPSGNHVHAGDKVDEEAEIDIHKARFRVELQALTRLPETRAVLFSFKTYLYSLDEIKREGLGPQLADAIEGLQEGNAPGMWVYKGGVRWGKAACEYLRAGGGK